MNWVDLCIFLILFYFAYRGFAIGLVASIFNLLSSVLALIVALRFYTEVGNFFVTSLGASKFVGPVLGFFVVLLVFEFLLSFLLSFVYKVIYKFFTFLTPLYWVDKIAGIIPQLLMGIILLTATMIVLVRLPIDKSIKDPILASFWGKNVLPQSTLFEPQIRQMLGSIPQDTLLYLIPKTPNSEDSIKLSLPSADKLTLTVDEKSEQELFVLVNKERRDRGLKVLLWDPSIVPTARKHSKDMFERSYFSHVSPEGKSPFDRMSADNVSYALAGENLAFAPTVEIAHKGLMNSPGHRENILRPEFGRIGIGVIDGGIYGKMFTQNFAD